MSEAAVLLGVLLRLSEQRVALETALLLCRQQTLSSAHAAALRSLIGTYPEIFEERDERGDD